MSSVSNASQQVPNHILLTDLMAPIKPAPQPPKEKQKDIAAVTQPNYAMNQINIAPAGRKPLFAVIDATIAEEASFRTVYKRNDYVKSAKTIDVSMINRDNMYIRCFPYCDRMNHKYQNYNTACGRAVKLTVELYLKKDSDGSINDYDVMNNLIVTSFICTTKNELTKLPVTPVTKKELVRLARVNKDLVIAKLLKVDDPEITEWGKKYTLYYEINPLGSLWSCTEILDDCMHQLTCSFLFRCNPQPECSASVVENTDSTTSSTDTEPDEFFSVYVDIQSKPFQITSSIKEAIIKQQLKAVGGSQVAAKYKKHLMKVNEGYDPQSNNELDNGLNSTENSPDVPYRQGMSSFHALNDATAPNEMSSNVVDVVNTSVPSSSNANLFSLINKKYGGPGLKDVPSKDYDSSDTDFESGSLNKRRRAEIPTEHIPRDLENVEQLLDTVCVILNKSWQTKVTGNTDDMLIMLPGKSEYVVDSMNSNLETMDKFGEVLNQFKPQLRRFTSTFRDSIRDQSLEELAMNNFFSKFKSAYCRTVTNGIPTLSLFSIIAESMSDDIHREE